MELCADLPTRPDPLEVVVMDGMHKPGTVAYRKSLTRTYERRLVQALKSAASDCGRIHVHAGAPAMPVVAAEHRGDGRYVVTVVLELPPADNAAAWEGDYAATRHA